MPLIERDVVNISKDKAGNTYMDFPVTRLANIEDSAEVKQAPVAADYIPLMDSADGGQMKKMPFSVLAKALNVKIFQVGTVAPTDTGLLWIDTTANTGGLKYYNGTAWVHVPVAYT